MDLKLLQLKSARRLLVNSSSSIPDYPNRRNFIRTMGLGVMAMAPVTETIKSISATPFSISVRNNTFTVTRNEKVAWKISDHFFERNYRVHLKNSGQSYILEASNLKIRDTKMEFSLNASIFKKDDTWLMKILIPEFSVNQEVKFLDWLDGTAHLTSQHAFDQQFLKLGTKDHIQLSGNSGVKISAGWSFALQGKDLVSFNFQNNPYATDSVTIKPAEENLPLFSRTFAEKSAIVHLPEFKLWNTYFEKIEFYEHHRLAGTTETNASGLNILLGRNNQGKDCKAVWTIQNDAGLCYWPDSRLPANFKLDKYLYFGEYSDTDPYRFYLAGKLKPEGQWSSNPLGAFRFQNDELLPVFEAFGTDNRMESHVFEPMMTSFHPHIAGATTLPFTFAAPIAVQINPIDGGPEEIMLSRTVETGYGLSIADPQDPPGGNNAKKMVKPSANATIASQLRISFDEIRFNPRRAIKINVLRPEDMLLLQFEFHNFKFSNQGQAPFLELDDTNSKGVVVVYFPSQHTLEEAFFESNNLPTSKLLKLEVSKFGKSSSSGEPVLPVKQVRARKSRLVYELQTGSKGFPLVMEELLDWSKFELRVHPRAYIKLANLFKPVSYPVMEKNIPQRFSSREKYLQRDARLVEYSVRMAQTNRIKTRDAEVYSASSLENTLRADKVETVRPAFNIMAFQGVNLQMGPVSESNTSIEAPAMMYISPNQLNDFTHKIKLELRDLEVKRIDNTVINSRLRAADPLEAAKGEIAELWHTRLGVKLKNGKISVNTLNDLKTIRVLWADDALTEYNKPAPKRDTPFLASLDGNNRHKLVHQTSNYLIPNFSPIPVPVKNLMLSSLGAYLNWHAFFNIQAPTDTFLNISEWEHIATLGRDHYVKIVEKGYLFPFGHRAALVKVTERKFHPATRAAVNRQRMYIVVLQKEVLYSRNDPAGKFIEFPFQEIRIDTLATPNIDRPTDSTIIKSSSAYNFYINVGGEGFKFDITATDKDGFEHRFRMPLMFLENIIARDAAQITGIINDYNAKTSYNLVSLWNQKIAYAASLVDGDTMFETESITFGGQVYPAKGDGDIKYHPKVQEAKVYIKQVEELTGARNAASISLEDDNNDGHIFAKVAGAVVDFTGGSDKSGGFLSPNMAITGLSKLQGPISGDIEDLKKLVFNVDKFFKALDSFQPPKIFGSIDIISLLGSPSLGGTFDSLIETINKIRKEIDDLKNEILYLENQAKETAADVKAQIDTAKKNISDKVKELLNALNSNMPKIPGFKAYVTEEAAYAEYKWQPDLKGEHIPVIPDILQVNVQSPSNALSVLTKVEKPFDASKAASINATARFEKFGIDIIPLLEVNFNYLEFKSGSSQKTDIKVDINPDKPIVFKGALSFVNNLQSIIPSTGFSEDGPYIELKPTGVTAGFNISIPSVQLGICMICNISLGANVTLPFTGAPMTMGFNFCTRENPFLLTISCFGGGGYFNMVTTLYGIQMVEAAFEFGAAMSLNVGVASGGVSAMGGFYFKVEKVTKEIAGINRDLTEVKLTGYLRINGHLSVLGLITVSLEFYLAFNAVFVGDKVEKLEGEATLKVKVEVLFFSKTVSVTVRRELKGADADPKFVEMVEPDDWQQYCIAFAS